MGKYFGKYRGKVIDNQDPRRLGRLKVVVPEVGGDDLPMWALPCVPYAGKGVGLWALPSIGSAVWVEFEGGEPDYPIVAGGFWLEGQVPAMAGSPDVVGLFSPAGSLFFSGRASETKTTLTFGTPGNEANASISATIKDITISINNTEITISHDRVDIATSHGAVKISDDGVCVQHGEAKGVFSSSGVSINGQVLKTS